MMSKAAVLIVEDSYIVAFHLQKTLEREGYIVVGTEPSGEKALQTIETRKPDIVLMDIMLGGNLDGIETARTIRSRFHLPVIYITALTDSETIQRAKITEPFGYLTKPFEDREVFTVIEMALYKHSIETKLRESEERYFSTVKSISDGVVVTDRDFRITYINPSAEKITGWNAVDCQRCSVFDIFRLKDLSSLEFPVNPFQSALDTAPANTLPATFALVDKHNTEKPIEGSLSPLIDSKGIMIGQVMIFRDISEKIAHQKLLKEFEKAHVAALIKGQEEERSRIAKDLHDGLGQILNAIKMNINVLVSDTDKANTLYGLLDEAIQESVRISENLVPSKLKDFDLATCIRSLCKTIHETTKAPVSFESFGDLPDINITQKTNLYRITQEALSNAIKHAGASTISVQLYAVDDDTLQLMIEDDGKGFIKNKPYDRSQHHGLDNMKERTEIMGGSLTVESDSDRGTLIIVEAPIKKN